LPSRRIGDFIECQGIEGKVENILVRETHIRKTDDQLIIVPNSLLFKNPLLVLTDKEQRRTTIVCGIAYGEDVDKARDVIRKAVASSEGVLTDHKPSQIFAQEFADSSINFEVTWWTGSRPIDVRESRDAVVAAVKRALDDAGIEIPFPDRTLTFKDGVPVQIAKYTGSLLVHDTDT
jgi:small conductance mechanosensitive channel